MAQDLPTSARETVFSFQINGNLKRNEENEVDLNYEHIDIVCKPIIERKIKVFSYLKSQNTVAKLMCILT